MISTIKKSKLRIARLDSPPDIDRILIHETRSNLDGYSNFHKIEPMRCLCLRQKTIVKLLDSTKDKISHGFNSVSGDNGKYDIAENLSVYLLIGIKSFCSIKIQKRPLVEITLTTLLLFRFCLFKD